MTYKQYTEKTAELNTVEGLTHLYHRSITDFELSTDEYIKISKSIQDKISNL